MNKRAWVYGSLGAVVVASWAALGQRPAGPVKVTHSDAMPQPAMTPAPSPLNSTDRKLLEAALRDPFVPVAPPPPPAPPPAPAPKVLPPPPPPPPAAPALNLQYTGRMLSPDGTVTVFANFGSEPVTLTAGMELPNGYRVEKVSDAGVELIYPPLGERSRLAIPPYPMFEIR